MLFRSSPCQESAGPRLAINRLASTGPFEQEMKNLPDLNGTVRASFLNSDSGRTASDFPPMETMTSSLVTDMTVPSMTVPCWGKSSELLIMASYSASFAFFRSSSCSSSSASSSEEPAVETGLLSGRASTGGSCGAALGSSTAGTSSRLVEPPGSLELIPTLVPGQASNRLSGLPLA